MNNIKILTKNKGDGITRTQTPGCVVCVLSGGSGCGGLTGVNKFCKMLQNKHKSCQIKTQSLDAQSEAALMDGFWETRSGLQWAQRLWSHIGSKVQGFLLV